MVLVGPSCMRGEETIFILWPCLSNLFYICVTCTKSGHESAWIFERKKKVSSLKMHYIQIHVLASGHDIFPKGIKILSQEIKITKTTKHFGQSSSRIFLLTGIWADKVMMITNGSLLTYNPKWNSTTKTQDGHLWEVDRMHSLTVEKTE
jgi:hypothetical protein